jgi:signal peptidase I
MAKFVLHPAIVVLVVLGTVAITAAVHGTASDAHLDDLTAELDSVRSAHDQLRLEKAALDQQLNRLAAQLTTSHQQIDELNAQVNLLTNVSTEYVTLQAAVGSLEDIEKDIRELQALREPLIPDTSVGTFACTGSMEPKITCLDSATWLTDFDPADITTGTVISFRTTPDCNVSSGNIAHRVVGIQEINGVLHFRPKGDNNWTDDGCWIPEDHVNSYMIELHEGTQPQNAALREAVNTARAAYDRAIAASNQGLAVYRAYMSTFCPNDTCPEGHTAEADALYSEAHSHLAETQQAANAYVAALEKARGR